MTNCRITLSLSTFVTMSDEVYDSAWHALYILITIPILFGNGLIIVSIFKFRTLRCNIHILIGNLAVADLMVGAILIPFDLIAKIGRLNGYKYVCLIKLSMFVISLGSSCYGLLIISIERFAAIVSPLRARAYFTKYKLVTMIATGWILPFINGTLPLYGWNTYGENNTECVSDTLFTSEYKLMCNWELVAALITNFVLYTIVMNVALRKAKATNIGGEMTIHSRAQRDLQQLTTMVIVLGIFALCWLPYVCISVVITFYETSYTQYIRRYTLIPGIFNSAINWIIYGYRNSGFRKAFKIILRLKPSERNRPRIENNNNAFSIVHSRTPSRRSQINRQSSFN